MRRLSLVALILVVLLGGAAPSANAQGGVEAVIYERAQAHGVSGRYVACIAFQESSYNPRAVGALGEQGLFQLLPGGDMRARFNAMGYADVWSVYEQADFAAWAVSQGLDRNAWWIASRRCA